MPLKKLCSRCGRVIDYRKRYCSTCSKEVEQLKRNRYKKYKANRKDTKEQKFYSSSYWQRVRQVALTKYLYIDVYVYYFKNEIVEASTVHHIIETKREWGRRLDISNLFICSKETHKLIHDKYKNQGEARVQNELLELNKRFIQEFNL
ncbi:hypothetical protein [Clostridium botulinum]|uniref:hypothetical protein n=1 Tax=Clostridium botulinum TaxID=1491 RepID=UPI00069BA310|nr:hypothetical protein [Clostridium botulinum]KOA90862.1 hypothetical protein ADU76_12470 [Clostridium botulinum]MCD3203426.1 HNH endonuclease [Clostridium botulinum C/D]MCD3222289.1 HNH endonuclease [Clostridium botulinum C/D]MCD3231440.1 HNH endonuclease [Clostridium botulinum C/D]MCD3273062.1 HNH endonuclease [Clostridium botulinum C/D]